MTYLEYVLLRIKTIKDEKLVRFPIEERINKK
jgi:hypothetical protein